MPTQAAATAGPPIAETITVTDTVVACDGGGALGHPRVFLALVDGRIVCPYCSRVFVLAPEGAGASG